MNKKRVRELQDLVIDEISLVDKGANQHATVTIAKRHGEEEQDMAYYDEDGNLVDIDSLELGDVVFDEQGDRFEYVLPDEEDDDELEFEDEDIDERELVGAGVSKAFQRESQSTFADAVRVELSKALTDADRDEVISKALGRVEEFSKMAEDAQAAAEAERQLRLEREYTEIAKNYNVPVAPEDLARVLMHVAEVLPMEDQEVIAKCLDATSASEDLFREYGNRGGGDNADVFSQVEALVDNTVSKSDESHEELIAKAFEMNPEAYDQYLAERQGR